MDHVTTSSNVNISAVSTFLRLPNYAQFNFNFLKMRNLLACTSKSKMVSVYPTAATIL
jgi:hypothetical protein